MPLPTKRTPRARTRPVGQVRAPNVESAFSTLVQSGQRLGFVLERRAQIARTKYLTGLAPDLRKQINDLANENFDDPAGFAAAIEGLVTGSIKNSPDAELSEAIETLIRREGAAQEIRLTNAKFNRDRKAAFISSETEKDVARGRAGALARDGSAGGDEFKIAMEDFKTLQATQVEAGSRLQEQTDAELADLGVFTRSQAHLFTFETLFSDKGRSSANKFAREVLTDASNGFTPEQREALDADFNRLGSRLSREENAANQQVRAALEGQLKDAEAAANRPGGRRRDILSDREIRGAFGDDADRIIDELNFLEETTAAVEEMALMSPGEIAALINAATPEGEGFDRENRRQVTLIRAAQQRQKLINDDPAQFALTNAPGLATAFEAALQANDPAALDNVITASVEAQRHIGVLSPRILPKGMAGRKVELFTSALAEEDRARALLAEINNSKALFGENFRQVMAELVEAGLPEEAEGIVYLENDIGASTRFASAVNQGREVLRKAAGPDVTEIDVGIEDQLGELAETLSFYSDGGRLINSIRSSAQLQGYQFAINGQNPQEAANSAGDDFINNRYAFEDSYRIPKAFDVDRVNIAARLTLTRMTTDDFVPLEISAGANEEEISKDQLNSLKSNGRWVTNPDDSGLTLMWPAETGLRPVVRPDGEPLSFTFDELVAMDLARGRRF